MRRSETKRRHRRRSREQRIHQRSVARRYEDILSSTDRNSSGHEAIRLEAAADLKPIITEIPDPTAQELLFNAARHAGASGEIERSVAIYRELLEINPSFLVARREMALRMHQLRDTQEALEQLERCLIERPDDVTTLIQRATILGALRMFEAAEGDLHRALAADPANVSCHQQLGILMTRRGLWREALPFLRRAIELDPGSAAAYRHLGDAMNQVDNLQGALQAYGRSVELQPDNAKAYRGLGVIHDRLGQPKDAATMYRRSRELETR